jgi:hypothetical protein
MIGSALDLSLPLIGDTMANVVAKTATALAAIEDVLEAKVTPASMNLNAEMALGGNRITGLGALTLVSAAVPTAAGSMYYADGEFYLIDATGAIQVTSEGALNLGATGTIVGDYGGVNPARVTYDDASGEYRFTEETGIYADLVADDVILKSAAGSVRLGATNDITTARSLLVKELAASGVSVMVYNAATSTLEMAETTRATNDVKVTTLNATGNATVNELRHTGNMYKALSPLLDGAAFSGTVTPVQAFGVQYTSAGGSYFLYCRLKYRDRLKGITLRLNKTSGGNITVQTYRMNGLTGALATIGAYGTQGVGNYTTAGVGDYSYIITGSPAALDANEDVVVYIGCPATGDQILGAAVVWDAP